LEKEARRWRATVFDGFVKIKKGPFSSFRPRIYPDSNFGIGDKRAAPNHEPNKLKLAAAGQFTFG
jgi:hypothetical protein